MKERSYLVIEAKEVRTVKEVIRSDGLWRFACGDVSTIWSCGSLRICDNLYKYNKMNNAIIYPLEAIMTTAWWKNHVCDSSLFAEPDRMELPDIPFNKAEHIETASGNRVSRASVLCGSQNIILNGKNIVQSEAIIRGDLANVRVGRHCVISSKAVGSWNISIGHCMWLWQSFQVIRPPFKKFSKGVAFFPLQVKIFFLSNFQLLKINLVLFSWDWGPCLHWRGECYQCSSGQLLCLHW